MTKTIIANGKKITISESKLQDTLESLSMLSDDKIDASDIPEISDDLWVKATIISPKNKKQMTIRLDDKVVKFFKSKGKGYQSKINSVLLSYVKHSEGRDN
jgi:uncharacterized protein (DUF4415 family)